MRLLARLLSVVAVASILSPLAVSSVQPPSRADDEYAALRERAERAYDERSFSQALRLYDRAAEMELPADARRWVAFRIADARWRAQAGSATTDQSVYEQSRRELEQLIRDVRRAPERDDVWALAHDSLGDFWWDRNDSRNFGAAWSHYQQALDYWAGSSDLDRAREHYMAIVRTMAEPRSWGRDAQYFASAVPPEIFENALEIAEAEDRPYLHYQLARTIQHRGGSWTQRSRVIDHFEAAIAAGRTDHWYDDALYFYGQWLAGQGRIVRLPQGRWQAKPDFVRAVEVYRRLVREFRPGESQYVDDARQQIEQITLPVLGVGVSNVFLPGSEVEFALSWRNLDRVELTLVPLSLVRDVAIDANRSERSWAEAAKISTLEPARRWTFETEDDGTHQPGSTMRRMEPLEPGAYVLRATGGGKEARELILVTEASVVVKADESKLVAYCCDALTGAPLADAQVRLWTWHNDGRDRVRDQTRSTDDQGLAVFEHDAERYVTHMVASSHARGQALAQVNSWHRGSSDDDWRIYAFTDRPAYRPGDTVRWKSIARRTANGQPYTPGGATLKYRIDGPQGDAIDEGELTLNEFGSGWGDVELQESMPLGSYRITFIDPSRSNRHVGSAELFRLEEYKLPEFRVSVGTSDAEGRPRRYRVGESVEADVVAEYYFGGPVSDATVEAVVYQTPFNHWWRPEREFPWCYEPQAPRHGWYGQGQIVARQTLRTDATGRATVRFDTPEFANQDFEYRIEARVVDASRREITASDTVRVTRNLYFTYLEPQQRVYRPGESARIEVRTIDANDRPVSVSGAMLVERLTWKEIWIDPRGREVQGEALRRLRARRAAFPPPPAADGGAWRLKFRGYEVEEILQRTVKTDDAGRAELSFTPSDDGYYRVSWRSPDALEPDAPLEDDAYGDWITAETMVWVASDTTRFIGYQHGGVDIIVDRDTIEAGKTATVVISTPTNDRHVLFTIEGERLYDHRVVSIPGNVRLIEVPVTASHIPNVTLTALMVSDARLAGDQEAIVVPPVRQYLDVTLSSDQDAYEPQETGTLTVTARDHDGKPVAAEVAIAVYDESVEYIQGDLAGDPRAFFFDRRQGMLVQTSSTFNYRQYVTLVPKDEQQPGDGGGGLEDLSLDDERREGAVAGLGQSRGRAGGGAVFGDAADAVSETASAPQMMSKAAAPLAASRRLAPGGANLDGAAPGGGAEPAVQVRSDFRATLVWLPDVVTDASGSASVPVPYADSLTTWKSVARVATREYQFGTAMTTTRTRKPLIARLQAPRFFVVGDTVTLSAVINNNTDEPMPVGVVLDADGVEVLGIQRDGRLVASAGGADVEVPAGRDTRVDWQVRVRRAGPVALTVEARGRRYADGMTRTITAYEHGIEKLLARSLKLSGGDEAVIHIDLPSQRREGSTAFTVQIAPSMAVTMLDALPYLIDYPYGCTEQTMSRFLPAAIVASTLRELNLDPETAMSRAFGGIEDEAAAALHGKPKSLDELDAVTAASLKRLYDMQHGDGGWGWWKDGDTDRYMTAYVVWGMSLAATAGIDVDREVLRRGAAYLGRELVEEEFAYDRQAWMLHATAAHAAATGRQRPDKAEARAIDNLFEHRDELNAYTRALFALALHQLGDGRRAAVLARNLEDGVARDDATGTSTILRNGREQPAGNLRTAHWGRDGVSWRWSEGSVESTAFALRALLAIDPDAELVEPAATWLIGNRRGAQWTNTRDTSIAILALTDYLKASGELTRPVGYELEVNGRVVERRTVTPQDALAAPSRFTIDDALIVDGRNEVRVRRTDGEGPLYIAAEAAFFSLEEPVPAAGNHLFVRRDYYRYVPKPTLLKGFVYERVALGDEDYVDSGDRVEVVLTVETKNDLEYLVFEDLKPAGLEAVAVRSGEPQWFRELKSSAIERVFAEQAPGERIDDDADYTGQQRWVHQELRDRKVAMFVDRLPQGVWQIRYDLRAEVPGHFHALPVLGHAMYVPEIKGNGDEIRLTVRDR